MDESNLFLGCEDGRIIEVKKRQCMLERGNQMKEFRKYSLFELETHGHGQMREEEE